MVEHNFHGDVRAGEPDQAIPDRTHPGQADKELAALRAQVAELDDRWRRAAAELDNLRKRVARDAER
jgi:molecular chaperone GrpE